MTAPSSIRKPVTSTPSTSVAPPICAPFIRDRAASPGFTVPSVGKMIPPTMSSTFATGHRSFTSDGVSGYASIPKSRPIETLRRLSCWRASVRATVSDPARRSPVSIPVSAGNDS